MPAEQAKLIDQPWMDLHQLSSETIDRNLLSAMLINVIGGCNNLIPPSGKSVLALTYQCIV